MGVLPLVVVVVLFLAMVCSFLGLDRVVVVVVVVVFPLAASTGL
jgi:hypothetical protein